MSYFNVKTDAARLEEMLRISDGQRRVPVIAVDGDEPRIGFGGT